MTDEADTDQREHWGTVDHYTIAGAACQLGPAGTTLAQLLRDNRDRIAISDIEIVAGNRYEPGQRGAFVALADGPALGWRTTWPRGGARGQRGPRRCSPRAAARPGFGGGSRCRGGVDAADHRGNPSR